MNRRTVVSAAVLAGVCGIATAAPIQIGFLWHMHQPRYVPGETIFGADPFFSFSVPDIHNQRFGPYTNWPKDAIDYGDHLPYLGAQVSFSGSLISNLDELEAAGVNGGMWNNWGWAYRASQSNLSALGNRRLELVAFAHHHALLPLLDERDIQMQVKLYKQVYGQTWQSGDSHGMFPPETAFSTRIIPALVAEGIDWVLVDNIHFDRACVGYPHTNDSGLFPTNKADQINPDPAVSGGRWVQLNNLWAPSRVSVPFGYQPHTVEHIDPATGAVTRMTAVPAARYEGNEDGRGGYGAFLYDQVMDAYLPDNDDPNHPMFVMLHHDGDNFGGGSDGYYHHNFQNMVNWVQFDPDYEVSTVNDYLDRFPVAAGDVIHVEDGSWAGADNGDVEFKKWLGGDVSPGGISPDINSWAVLTAAKNRVFTLDDANGGAVNMNNVLNGIGSPLDRAWHHLLEAEASDYWYWDGTEVWDSNVTRGSNLATAVAVPALASITDATGPTIFAPQREPYNPGELEWGPSPEPSDFEVWTLVDDYSGLTGVTLRWRVDNDGSNPINSTQNETYAGGPEVGAWNSIAMTAAAVPTPSGVLAAAHKASRYGAMITAQENVLIDYYITATDTLGNTTNSNISHVWVGDGTTGGGDRVVVLPDPPQAGQNVTIQYDEAGGPLSGASQIHMHYGFNGWNPVISPDAAMDDSDGDGVWEITVPVAASAAMLDMVFNDGGANWDNNNGQDWHYTVSGGGGSTGFTIDGTLDDGATLIDSTGGLILWAGLDADTLYVATLPASAGNDRFLMLAETPGAMGDAPWAKAGQVAASDAFIGNEESNNWAGWADAAGATQVASGTVLEGTIDLAAEFGLPLPESVHLAVLSYATPDGGALQWTMQVPASNDNNGDVEPDEFVEVMLCALTDAGCCPADLTGDGIVDAGDLGEFITLYLAGDLAVDFTGDGIIDAGDLGDFITHYLAGC